MPSLRSKMIWDNSVALSQFVAQRVSAKAALPTLSATGFGWQLAEYLWKFADGYFGADKVPDHVRNAIMRSELIATGWRETPSRSAGPVIIPRSQFTHGQFRLLLNQVESGEHRYRDVRIAEKSTLAPELLADRPNQQLRQIQIANVIRELSVAGELRGKLRKQQISIVHAALKNAGVKNIGAEKTIERLIRRYSNSK